MQAGRRDIIKAAVSNFIPCGTAALIDFILQLGSGNRYIKRIFLMRTLFLVGIQNFLSQINKK